MFVFTPPPNPLAIRINIQRKRLSEKGVCKLLKIKGRFAQKLRKDASCSKTVPQLHVEYYHNYIYLVSYFT
jgi:hypothetical protein